MARFPPVDLGERILGVSFGPDTLDVTVVAGRAVSVALTLLPFLDGVSDAERQRFQIVSGGFGIRWPDLGTELSSSALLRGEQMMRRPQSVANDWFLWRDPAEPLRIMSEGQLDLARLSVDDVVERATAYLVAEGTNLLLYDGVSVSFYTDKLPDYVTGVPGEPAWLLWFWLNLAPGIDLFPDYTEVVVLDRNGETGKPNSVWQSKPRSTRKKRPRS